MEKIEIARGFTPQLTGKPDLTMIQVPLSPRVGVSAGDIPFIRPKLLVREGDRVQTGTPVFTDKRDRSINYVSPATGRVEKIVFGERRRLKEVIIATEAIDDFVSFEPVSRDTLIDMPKADLVAHLKQGGLWQGLRQFPAGDTADPESTPAMIIVSMNGNDLFSPHPAKVLEGNAENFHTGLALLHRFSHRIVVTLRESCLKAIQQLDAGVAEQITHVTDEVYPAWNPGSVLYQIKQNQAENASWSISLQHLIMLGQFLNTGKYPLYKVVTATQTGDHRPHMKVRQGTPLKKIAGHFAQNSLVTTGQFNGRLLEPDSHIGFFENTINILDDIDGEEMFGFVRPGLDKTTVSSSFLSSLFKRPQVMDGTLHGELRACINCSYCERICPVDLMPNFIMKALHADEVEEALALGMMDCCQCGLCSYTCPSKIELAKILSGGMESHHKDKA
ncbi:MAG: 4Fe-4S dicluster domain-containing protein [Desulfobacterales bacterium]|nr:4Fe-4S dicluster domain-containing protein [Desulfobacterales bacterium]